MRKDENNQIRIASRTILTLTKIRLANLTTSMEPDRENCGDLEGKSEREAERGDELTFILWHDALAQRSPAMKIQIIQREAMGRCNASEIFVTTGCRMVGCGT